VIDDSTVGSPDYAADLADASMALIEQQQQQPATGCNIYHYSNEVYQAGMILPRRYSIGRHPVAGVSRLRSKDYSTPRSGRIQPAEQTDSSITPV